MKIENKKIFTPVTIELETEEEVRELFAILYSACDERVSLTASENGMLGKLRPALNSGNYGGGLYDWMRSRSVPTNRGKEN